MHTGNEEEAGDFGVKESVFSNGGMFHFILFSIEDIDMLLTGVKNQFTPNQIVYISVDGLDPYFLLPFDFDTSFLIGEGE